MSQVTEKNTKKEILYAYEKALEQVKALESKVFDPESNKQKTITNIDLLETVGEELLNLAEEFNKLETSIAEKEAELKEIYNIEKEANTLVALVNAQAMKKEEFDKIETEKLDAIQNKINDALKEFEEKRKTKERELEDYEYMIEKKKKIMLDELDQQKEVHRKHLEANAKRDEDMLRERVNEIELRERMITEREEKYQERYDFEKKQYMLEKENELVLLNGRYKDLQDDYTNLSGENADLKDELRAANEKINQLAMTSMKKSNVFNVKTSKDD